jgi:hypothetical protein
MVMAHVPFGSAGQRAGVEDQAIMISMSAIRVLLRHSIDYAGLFPPAGLDLPAAVGNYARYRRGESAWALGRFILPVSRLSEFAGVVTEYLPLQPSVEPWAISALAGPDVARELDEVAAFNERQAATGAGAFRIEALEVKGNSAGFIEDTMPRVPGDLQVYFEVPIEQDPGDLVASIARRKARAKVRTGGVTRDAFPRTSDLVRFLQTCIRARVPFKATAGLHHPLRAEYRLTYAPDSSSGMMFGFLNLFLAAGFIQAGMGQDQATGVLDESSPEAFRVKADSITWRGHRLDENALRAVREGALISFGSCSFTEPIAELEAMGLLESRVQQA